MKDTEKRNNRNIHLDLLLLSLEGEGRLYIAILDSENDDRENIADNNRSEVLLMGQS